MLLINITNIKGLAETFYIDDFKNSRNSVKRLYLSHLRNKEIKLRYLYCVDKVMESFLNHSIKKYWENKDSIVEKYKK